MNRLVKVTRLGPSSSPQPVATYCYDGLGRRTYKKVENSGDRDRQECFYYNQAWQLLEIDDATGHTRQQFVWGSQYIDEPICMDVDTNNYGNCSLVGEAKCFRSLCGEQLRLQPQPGQLCRTRRGLKRGLGRHLKLVVWRLPLIPVSCHDLQVEDVDPVVAGQVACRVVAGLALLLVPRQCHPLQV